MSHRAHLVRILCLLLLAACSRPLAEAERGFAAALFGDEIDASRVRVSRGLGVVPLPARTAPPADYDLPGAFCDRGPSPKPVQGPPAAFVLWNRIHMSPPFYASDVLSGWPAAAPPAHAMVLAHELAHVWQWQNRAATGYRPFRAAGESLNAADPYFYRLEGAQPFLSFPFEQQASLIEDYVCYSLLAPDAPRRDEIRAVLAPVLPVDRFDALVAGPR